MLNALFLHLLTSPLDWGRSRHSNLCPNSPPFAYDMGRALMAIEQTDLRRKALYVRHRNFSISFPHTCCLELLDLKDRGFRAGCLFSRWAVACKWDVHVITLHNTSSQQMPFRHLCNGPRALPGPLKLIGESASESRNGLPRVASCETNTGQFVIRLPFSQLILSNNYCDSVIGLVSPEPKRTKMSTLNEKEVHLG